LTASNRYRDALAVGEYRAIFLAHLISMTGTVLAGLALTVLVYARTGSPLMSALTFAAGFLPQVLAGTVLSALVDRVDTRALLVGCNLLSGVVVLAMIVDAAASVIFFPLLCFAVQPGIRWAFLALFGSGLGASFQLGLDQLVLAGVPDQLRARPLAIQPTGLMFCQGIGFAATGAAAELLPARVVITAAGCCGLGVVVWHARCCRQPGSAP
jgi:hypothetical protein